MAVRGKVDTIDREIALIISEELSPEAQSKTLADFARVTLAETQEANRRVLGRVPPHETFVDGVAGAALERVRPGGTIVFEFELVGDVLVFIADELRKVSPVLSGRYRDSHTLFADGREVPVRGNVPIAAEFVFLSDVVYARLIEGSPHRRPLSRQAPKGVYQITAIKAAARFGNVAKISFSWRAPIGGALAGGAKGNKSDGRVPAIIVTLR